MIEFEVGEKVVAIPSEWDDLSESQLKSLCKRIRQFQQDEISIAECRMLWVCDILGVNLSKIPYRKQGNASDNLYMMSRQVTFFTQIKFEDGKLDAVSPLLKKLIRKTPPDDLPYSPEVAYLRRLPYDYDIDAVFFANLIPEVKIGDKTFKGYTATYSDGVLDTSLTAIQYITAAELLSTIGNGDSDKLPVLASVLYADIAQKNLFKALDTETLEAIAFNFQAVVLFLFTKTEFSILWKGGRSKSKGTITLSAADTLYDLSASGYGTPEQVENLSLLRYLRILKKNIISAVTMLREMGNDDGEIAEKTHLPANIISQIA